MYKRFSTYPSSNVSIDPVLVILILFSNEGGQDGDEGGEVEEGGGSSEPELHHQPVDSEFVERLCQTQVVDTEEDGAEEADDHHCQEPVLTVVVGGGGADDTEKCQKLKKKSILESSG